MRSPELARSGKGSITFYSVSEQRVALVTGASRGIGKQSAIALARAGLDVVVTARTVHEGEGVDDSDDSRRSLPGSLETTAREIEATGRRALQVPMDLHDRNSLGAAVGCALDDWGRIDVLVNNAVDTGPGSMARFDETPVEVIEHKLAANVVAHVVLIKAVLPGMLERGDGTVVNITSAVALIDPPAPAGEGGWGSAYAMSKGAFHRLAGILSVEYRDRGLRFFNVEPGFVLTERMAVNAEALGLEGVYPAAPPTVPAAVVAWLATHPEAETFNGQTISAQKFALDRGLHSDWR
jgi:NAD(P)-dependent dehydrogenase (short-subunit alcohol dehydrogenase family)